MGRAARSHGPWRAFKVRGPLYLRQSVLLSLDKMILSSGPSSLYRYRRSPLLLLSPCCITSPEVELEGRLTTPQT